MRRRVVTFLGALSLIAGCAGATGTPPVASTTPGPSVSLTPSATTPSQTAVPMQSPSPSPTAVSARVTFDGSTCVYSGPTVIPSPAVLTIEYAPTPAQEGSSVFIGAIRHGTTQADVDRAEAERKGVDMGNDPEWVDGSTFMNQVGSGSQRYGLQVLRNPDGLVGIYDEYIVSCITSIPGIPAPGGAILQLVEATASPAASKAP